jgi:cobaltochelatase CobS
MSAATTLSQEPTNLPDMKVSVRQVFGIDSDLEVPAYSNGDPHVPDVDSDYRFDRATTLAILAGFSRIAASWSPVSTAPASRPISSRSRPA